MPVTEITFVRHAESTYNVAGRWQGQGDAPLSERGRSQAAALGRRLAGEVFDLVVASDLTRAADTARALGRPVERDRAWRELDVGAWEGLTREEVDRRFTDQVAALQRGEPVRVGGGESWAELRVRALAALERLRARAEGQRVLVVSHGGLVLTLTAALLGLDGRRPLPLGHLDNTAITRLRFDGDDVEVRVYNDATHLAPIGEWTSRHLAGGATVVSLICGAAAEDPGPLAAVYPLGDDEPAARLRALADRHPGAHVGLVADGDRIAATAAGLLGRPGGARLGCPDGGCVAPVVVSRAGAALAAWNVPR